MAIVFFTLCRSNNIKSTKNICTMESSMFLSSCLKYGLGMQFICAYVFTTIVVAYCIFTILYCNFIYDI